SKERISRRDDLVEFGTVYGSWVVPSRLLSADSICYCAGCGEDISFDLGLIKRFGCDIFAFDPTPRAIAHVAKVAGDNPRYHFATVGLWDGEDTLRFYAPADPAHVSYSLLNLQKTEEYIDVGVKRLSSIMEESGHASLDLLKLDIEGAEYRVIQSMIEDGLAVRILCVEYDEYHNPLDAAWKRRVRASIESLLESGYSIACVQDNANYTFVKEQVSELLRS
ncbi:MAG TPA: FkbM family methyltransferase, partial [Candidatus Krumholzibacterium sp.]|nr:FkbM family methyltransferase [Candidatus Krumholzibacterium sp.]